MGEFARWAVGILRFTQAYLGAIVLGIAAFLWVSAVFGLVGSVWEGGCRTEGAQYCDAETRAKFAEKGKDPEKECFGIDSVCFNRMWLGIDGVDKATAAQNATITYAAVLVVGAIGTVALLVGFGICLSLGHGVQVRRAVAAAAIGAGDDEHPDWIGWKRCSACDERIREKARLCRHCGHGEGGAG